MADDKHSARSDDGLLDLKTLLRGAAGLIVVLAGLTWGLFNTNHSNEVDDLNRTNDKQWERLRALNDILIRQQAELEQAGKYIDDQEVRIRALEHRGERR